MASADPVILVILAADYDSARRKGVEHLFREYSEQGFFRKAILVSPYFRRDRCVALDAAHELHEFGIGPRWLRMLVMPIHVLRVIAACRRLVQKQGVRIIRATEPTLCGFIAWAVSRLTGIPYCLSLHADYDKLFELDGRRGAPAPLGWRALVRPLERLTFGGAVRVLPIRASLTAYAVRRGVEPARIRLIPHGIDLSPFEKPVGDIRQTLGLQADIKVVAFAGRLSRENYLTDLLDAVAVLAERRDDFVLVVAGGGVLERETAARLEKEPGLARVVRMLGFVPRATVVALRRTCTVSVCLMGGFSLIEACAGGRPVIAYDVEWHHEMVINGKTGRLIAERDIHELVRAISDLLDDESEAARMGAEARALAFSRHELGNASRVRRRWYQEMLNHDAA